LARNGLATGVPIAEVQMAVNALERTLWRTISGDVPVSAQPAALAQVSTVLGAVKDRLAHWYSHGHEGTCHGPGRVDSFFNGTEANLGGATS
jgi:hypothetical protein